MDKIEAAFPFVFAAGLFWLAWKTCERTPIARPTASKPPTRRPLKQAPEREISVAEHLNRWCPEDDE